MVVWFDNRDIRVMFLRKVGGNMNIKKLLSAMLVVTMLAGSVGTLPAWAEEEESSAKEEHREERHEEPVEDKREEPKEEKQVELKDEPEPAREEKHEEPKEEPQEESREEKQEEKHEDSSGGESGDSSGETEKSDEGKKDNEGEKKEEKKEEERREDEEIPVIVVPANTPEPETTPESEATPEPEVTPEPTVAPDAGSISVSGGSDRSAVPGVAVRFSFHAENVVSLRYRVVGPDGEIAASGDLPLDADSVSFTPSAPGKYTLVLVGKGLDGGDVVAKADVTVSDMPELKLTVTPDEICCHGGDPIGFTLTAPEGLELKSCSIKGIQSGSVFYEDSSFSEKVTVTPPAVGKVTDVTLTLSVTDIYDRTAEASATIPCAVHDEEHRSQWEATMAGVTLTGVWPQDLVAIARTQVGYKESSIDFGPKHGGGISGYTRYGDWAGMPYDEWCAMFCSFCLHYAGISEDQFPYASNQQRWIEKLRKLDLYASSSVQDPRAGDLVFFDWDGDGTSDHVGIVSDVGGSSFATIEGNSKGGAVTDSDRYDFDDRTVTGYGLVNKAYEAYAAREERTLKASTSGASVIVTCGGDARLPEDVRLSVDLVAPGDEGFDACVDALRGELDGEDLGWVRGLELRFTDGSGQSWEPMAPVKVTVAYPEKLVASKRLKPAVGTVGGDVDTNRDVALTRMSNACVFEFTQSDFGGTVCTYMSGALKYRRNALSAEAGGVTAKLAYTAKSRVPAGADLSLREIRADSDDYALCLARVDVEAGETVRFFEVGVTLNGMRVDLEGSATLTVACAQEAATARAVTLADGHTSDARLTHRKNGRVEARFTADTPGIVAVIYGK